MFFRRDSCEAVSTHPYEQLTICASVSLCVAASLVGRHKDTSLMAIRSAMALRGLNVYPAALLLKGFVSLWPVRVTWAETEMLTHASLENKVRWLRSVEYYTAVKKNAAAL